LLIAMDNSSTVLITSTSSTLAEDAMDNPCNATDEYLLVPRFFLAVVFGVALSIISICFNSFIFVVFVTSKQHRNSYNLYLLLLSLFDVFIGISYIAVISNNVLINWTASYKLKAIWVSYMVPMLTISHIGITASTYLITFAAIERYCITVNSNKVAFLQHHRKTIAFIAVMAGMISKGTMLEEVTIRTNPQCIGMFNEWEVKPSDLVIENVLFNKIWRFYFRNIFTILAPFFILLYLNAGLIYRLVPAKVLSSFLVRENKLSYRSCWLYRYLPFYVLSVALLSLLTVIASCLRLPIYITCQPLLRKEMYQFLCEFCFFG
uniref:G_PROTEIN_RECEP_F1_2 domain-containing protein n=1 Tax=Haemonchus placei TaxID=6290 RepID=A0A158QM08_HAEPC